MVRNKPNSRRGRRGRGLWGRCRGQSPKTNPISAILPVRRSAFPGGQPCETNPIFPVRQGRPSSRLKALALPPVRGRLRQTNPIPSIQDIPAFHPSRPTPIAPNKANFRGPTGRAGGRSCQTKPNLVRMGYLEEGEPGRSQVPGEMKDTKRTQFPVGPGETRPQRRRTIMQNKPNLGHRRDKSGGLVQNRAARLHWSACIRAGAALPADTDVAAPGAVAPEREVRQAPGQVRKGCCLACGTWRSGYLAQKRGWWRVCPAAMGTRPGQPGNTKAGSGWPALIREDGGVRRIWSVRRRLLASSEM
jgi:hypothetical protein